MDRLNKTGFPIPDRVPWGTHLCQFYETKDDLLVQKQALASSISPLVTSDLSGRLIYANPAALKAWGYDHRQCQEHRPGEMPRSGLRRLPDQTPGSPAYAPFGRPVRFGACSRVPLTVIPACAGMTDWRAGLTHRPVPLGAVGLTACAVASMTRLLLPFREALWKSVIIHLRPTTWLASLSTLPFGAEIAPLKSILHACTGFARAMLPQMGFN